MESKADRAWRKIDGLWRFLLGFLVAATIVIVPIMERRQIDSRNHQNGMTHIAGSALMYSSKYHTLPPAFVENSDLQPRHSWRAILLLGAFPEHAAKFRYRYDENWNSPFNSVLHETPYPYYHCPSDPAPENQTSYVAVVGSDTLFPGRSPRKLEEIVGTTTQRMAPDEVKYSGAGLSNTILFVEMHQSGIHWLEPRDISIEDALKGVNKGTPSISGYHSMTFGFRKGPLVVFADGRVQFLNSNIDPKVLRSLLEVNNPDKPKERFISP